MITPKRAGVVASGLIALSPIATASAHSGHPILRAERTVKLEADGREGLRLVVTVNYGAEQMLRVARRADLNGNGIVEASEIATFMDSWSDELARRLPVHVDGTRVRPRFVRPFYDPDGPVSLRPGTLEIVAEVPLAEGRHEIFVSDGMAADEFDRTDVMFEVTNEARLDASGPSAAPIEVVPSFAFGRSTELARVSSFGMVVEMPSASVVSTETDPNRKRLVPVAITALATVFAVAVGRLVRAMKARDAVRRS